MGSRCSHNGCDLHSAGKTASPREVAGDLDRAGVRHLPDHGAIHTRPDRSGRAGPALEGVANVASVREAMAQRTRKYLTDMILLILTLILEFDIIRQTNHQKEFLWRPRHTTPAGRHSSSGS